MSYYPEVDEYKMYLAQTLYKEGLYDEALKAAANISNPQYQQKLIQLSVLIRYEKNEIDHAKSLLAQGDSDDPETLVNEGCILYKEEKYDQARVKF